MTRKRFIKRIPGVAGAIEYRPIKGSLSDSMAEKIFVHTKEGIVRYLSELLAPLSVEVTADKLHINHYGYDDRIQWNTYIVTLDGFGVVGFTNDSL